MCALVFRREGIAVGEQNSCSPALPWLLVVGARQGSRTRQETDLIEDPSEGD